MIDAQRGKFEQQDAITDAFDQITRNPRVALMGLNLATTGTPINAPLNMLNNLIPAGAWGEETKRMPTYPSDVGKRTTSSPPSQNKYDADGKAIPSGNINKPTTSSPPRQNKYDADGKAIP